MACANMSTLYLLHYKKHSNTLGVPFRFPSDLFVPSFENDETPCRMKTANPISPATPLPLADHPRTGRSTRRPFGAFGAPGSGGVRILRHRSFAEVPVEDSLGGFVEVRDFKVDPIGSQLVD